MPRSCTICGSPSRREIERHLVGGTSYRNIAERFGTSIAALNRHKSHVAATLQKASEKRAVSLGESILARLEDLYNRAESVLAQAEKSRNLRAAIAAIRETRETLASVYALTQKLASDPGREVVLKVVYEDPPRPPERPLVSPRRALPPAPEPAPIFIHESGKPLRLAEPAPVEPEPSPQPVIERVSPPPISKPTPRPDPFGFSDRGLNELFGRR